MAPKRRLHWAYAGLSVLAVGILAWAVFHGAPTKPPAPRAVPVSVARAVSRDVPVSITSLGAAQAWTSVTIFAQVSGKLLSVNFVEGTDVQAGDLLAEIDPAPYRAALMQAQGALQRDRALLADAHLDLARYQSLAAVNAIAKQMVDTQAALVKQDEGIVMADEGTVAAAQVNLGWCRIVSPVSGRVGVRLVDPGNLVSAGGSVSSTPSTAAATNNSSSNTSATGGSGIVIVNQIQPIAVTFTVPEGDFQNLSTLSAGFSKPLASKAFSQETGALLDNGELSIADNKIDPATGTIELKARFPNADKRLWPGQFVNVQLTLQTLPHVTTVPQAAVNRGPNGNFLYVVGPKNTVSVRPIKIGGSQGSVVVIAAGLKPGETVVTDGQMTLKAGSLVKVIPAAPAKGAPY